MLTQHYLSLLVENLGDYSFTMLQLRSLIKWSLIQISIIADNISSQVVDKRWQGFGQWMNSSIIHDNICSLMHKKCHPESDIKHHMTRIIIFSVLPSAKRTNILLCAFTFILDYILYHLCPQSAYLPLQWPPNLKTRHHKDNLLKISTEPNNLFMSITGQHLLIINK